MLVDENMLRREERAVSGCGSSQGRRPRSGHGQLRADSMQRRCAENAGGTAAERFHAAEASVTVAP
jgi:hypothetical protein